MTPMMTVLLKRASLSIFLLFLGVLPGLAADRERVERFLEITGFDVALESIALGAGQAPQMLGLEPGRFGADWKITSEIVFDTRVMHRMAVDILEQALEDDLLDHAIGFYASNLGQRLVAVENDAHMEEGEDRRKLGEDLLAEMGDDARPRMDLFKRMSKAIDPDGIGVKALQEIQIRFLLAASAAGVIELRLDEGGLRALMAEREPEMRTAIANNAVLSSSYTYRAFDLKDLTEYVEALEDPRMQRVYELLNAVQYEITANRFEALAVRLSELQPGQDI